MGGEDSFIGGNASNWGDASIWGVPVGVPFLRRDEQLGLPCPKSLGGAGLMGLKGVSCEAET